MRETTRKILKRLEGRYSGEISVELAKVEGDSEIIVLPYSYVLGVDEEGGNLFVFFKERTPVGENGTVRTWVVTSDEELDGLVGSVLSFLKVFTPICQDGLMKDEPIPDPFYQTATPLSEDVLKRDYKGCGLAMAAVQGGEVVALRYRGDSFDQAQKARTVAELSALGEVFVGSCFEEAFHPWAPAVDPSTHSRVVDIPMEIMQSSDSMKARVREAAYLHRKQGKA